MAKKKVTYAATKDVPAHVRVKRGFEARIERLAKSACYLAHDLERYADPSALGTAGTLREAARHLVAAGYTAAQIPPDARPTPKPRASKWAGALVTVAERHRPLYEGTAAGLGAILLVLSASAGLLRCTSDGLAVMVLAKHTARMPTESE